MSGEVKAFEGGDKSSKERNQIDEQIHSLRQQILQLCNCTDRNQLAPVATLPVEVLTKIFLLVRDTTVIGRSYTALDLSWVCREWRTVALDSPLLWNFIDSPDLVLVKTFLERSKEVEVGFSLANLIDTDTSANSSAVKSLPRLYTLRLEFQVPKRQVRCKSAWAAPAPILQQLQLKSFILPDDMFSGVYPSLYELSLTSCSAATNQLPISPHLTILRILSPYSRTPVEGIVNILQTVPHIKCLELSEALLVGAGAGPNEEPRIPLLNMQIFTLKGETCGVAAVLCSRLCISSNARISLKLRVEEEDSDVSDTVLAVQESRSQPTWEIGSLNIQVDAQRFICSYAEDTPSSDDINTTIEFLIDSEADEGPFAQDVMDICQSLRLDHLKQLTMEGKLEYDAELWRLGFGTLPNLLTLIIRDPLAGQFVRYLKEEAEKLVSAEQTANPLVPPRHQPTFRRLQSLTLKHLRQTAPDYADISLLLWALGPRKIYLDRLPKLVFEGAQLPDEVIASFSHLVEQVLQEPVAIQEEHNEGDDDEDLDSEDNE